MLVSMISHAKRLNVFFTKSLQYRSQRNRQDGVAERLYIIIVEAFQRNKNKNSFNGWPVGLRTVTIDAIDWWRDC